MLLTFGPFSFVSVCTMTFRRFGPYHEENGPYKNWPPTFHDFVDLYDEAAMKIMNERKGNNKKALETIHSEKIIIDASPPLMWDNYGWHDFLNWSLSSTRPRQLVRSEILTF